VQPTVKVDRTLSQVMESTLAVASIYPITEWHSVAVLTGKRVNITKSWVETFKDKNHLQNLYATI